MFGCFNKLLDALGIPLESNTYSETVDVMDGNYTVGKGGQMLSAQASRAPPPAFTDDWMLKMAYQWASVFALEAPWRWMPKSMETLH
jgi:hypothetical protein